MQHAKHSTVAAIALMLMAGTEPAQSQAEDQTYYASVWNYHQVYLSPATHGTAAGAQGECQGNKEDDMAYWTAWDATNGDYYLDVYQPTHRDRSLLSRGYDVKIGAGDYQVKTNRSNDWGADLHIPIHSNADVHGQCLRTNAGNFGTVTMHYYTSQSGANLGQLLLDYVGSSSPGTPPREQMCPNPPPEPCTSKNLLELSGTRAVAAYLETEFHTWNTGIEWITRSFQWAWRIGEAVDVHLGRPQPRP